MDMYTLIGFALAAAVLAFTVRSFDQRAGRNLAIAATAFILLTITAKLSGIADAITGFSVHGALGGEAVKVSLKAVGIAYLSRISSAVCRDLDENALASASELIGRVLLVTLALPIFGRLLELITELVGSAL